MQISIMRNGPTRGGRVKQTVPRAGRSRQWIGLAAVLGALVGLGGAALGQSGLMEQPRERLLGTFETRVPREATELKGSDAGHAATRMLADAMHAFESGEVMLGRRRLEVLVERYPDTLAASTARQELGRLYIERRAVLGESAESRTVPWTAEAPAPVARAERANRDALNGARLSATASPDASLDREGQGRRQRLQDERRGQLLARDFQSTAGDRVFFGETDAELGARARAVLVAQARWLAAHSDLNVEIEAHADDNSSPAFNFKLAERRGKAVVDRLIAEGVAAGQITLKVYGSERPVATCAASECAAQNRRVVTLIGALAVTEDDERTKDGGAAVFVDAPEARQAVRRD